MSYWVSVSVVRIKAVSHLATLNHLNHDLGILKRQHGLFKTPAKKAFIAGDDFINVSNQANELFSCKPLSVAEVEEPR
jgi:hypothetical protein